MIAPADLAVLVAVAVASVQVGILIAFDLYDDNAKDGER